MFIKDFEKINKKTLSILVLNLLLLIGPGVAILYLFNNTLFLQLDFPKLTLLSIAIISPLLVINFFFGLKKEETLSNMSEDDAYGNLTLSIFMSAFNIYLTIILKLLFKFFEIPFNLILLSMSLEIGIIWAYIKENKVN
jgi:hypothetical protein